MSKKLVNRDCEFHSVIIPDLLSAKPSHTMTNTDGYIHKYRSCLNPITDWNSDIKALIRKDYYTAGIPSINKER